MIRKVLLPLILCLVLINKTSGQTCTGSTPANPGARTGNLYTTTTIDPGSTSTVHWFQGTASGATITMSGTSKLIIKTGSNLALSGAYTIPNGCMIYVESGATLTLGGNLTLGDASSALINLGTINVTGQLSLGSGAVYNDGTINFSSFLWITSTTFVFLNGGSASFSHVNYQVGSQATSSICLRPGSVFNMVTYSGYIITGSPVALPSGGLFKYNATDISNNSTCTPANPARINYYDGPGATNSFLFGPSGTVADHANITIVGSIPAASGTGACVLVTSGIASAPQNFILSTFSPAPFITGSYFNYCLNSTVPMTTIATGTNLLWYTAATGGSGSSTAPTVNTTSAGLQTFWVNQNVTGTCLGPRISININVTATSANSLTASNNGPICSGATLNLSATAGAAVSAWSWTGPNSFSSSSQNPSIAAATPAATGTYTLIATQTTGSCRHSATTTATVSSSIPATPGAFTTSSSSVCKNQTNVTYTVPPVAGATSYTWSYGGAGAAISGTSNAVSINYSLLATSGTLSVSATNTCGSSAARTLAITVNNGIFQLSTSNMIAYYKFNNNANDHTNTNQGTLQNAPSTTTDRFGNASSAYDFNGSNQYISTANSYTNPTNFTISIWFKTTTTTGGKLINFGNNQTGGSGNYDRQIYMSNSGRLYFTVNPSSGYTVTTNIAYNDGEWHLATGTVSSTNGMRLYVDGMLISSNALGIGGQNYTGYWRIGYDNMGAWPNVPTSLYFKGALDDVMIFHRELSAAEITTLYTSVDGAGSNTPVCTNGTINLSATTLAGSSYGWTGPNSFSASSQNPSITNMSASKEGTYALTVTSGSCVYNAYALGKINTKLGPDLSQVPGSNLSAHYKLDGSAKDETNNNHGDLQNTPSLTTDRFGIANKAYSFNGSNQYIATSITYNNPSNLSLSLWFKTNTTTGGKLIGLGNQRTGGSTNFDRHIYMSNAGQLYFGVNPGTGRITINSTASYNDNAWHHVTATLSSTNGIKLYVDGILVANNGSPLGGENYVGYWKIGFDAIGGTWAGNPSSPFFNGSIDDVLIYTTELTASNVGVLYQSANGAGNNGPVCTGTSLTLSSTTVGGASYSWTGPNSFSSSSQNPSLTYLSAYLGVYTLNVTQAGCISTAYSLVSESNTPGQWTGAYSNSWHTANNWCNGTLPTSSTDITIPASAVNMPTITATATLRNLTIAPSASLTNNSSGTLHSYGNFTNNGTYNDDGLTVFGGATTQTLTGATTLHSVVVNNAAGVTLNSPTYIEGHLTLSNGTLASGGNLTVDLNTGAITGAGNGSISGDLTVLKWIWSDQYHYISSPLSGRTVTDWNDNVLIKFGANANLYTYDETVPDPNKEVGWNAVTSTATTIEDMKGYALYFPRWIYRTTLDLTGPYNHAQTYSNTSLSNTSSGNTLADGWNLVGNPYPCVIDWDAPSGWTKTGLDHAIYLWDQQNNRYSGYVDGASVNGGTRYIPAMQGFYVIVSNPGTGTLGMNNDVRSTAANPNVLRIVSEEKTIRLKTNQDTYSDETLIRFKDQATDQFDSKLDAYKIPSSSNTPSISTYTNHIHYMVNTLPNSSTSQTIPVKISAGISGNHNINADIIGFGEEDSIVLEDRLLGIHQNLYTQPNYLANLIKGDTTTRFFLHYQKANKENMNSNHQNVDTEKQGIKIYSFQQTVNIVLNEEPTSNINIAIYDASGNNVYARDHVETTTGKIAFRLNDLTTGIYIVKVQTQTNTKTQQVYLSR